MPQAANVQTMSLNDWKDKSNTNGELKNMK